MSGTAQHLPFYDWLIALSACAQASSMSQHVSEFPFFFRVNSIPLLHTFNKHALRTYCVPGTELSDSMLK